MAAPLTALGRLAADPTVNRCGCGAFAHRGFPNGVWFATRCVPPALRFPWEPGYLAPAAEAPPPVADQAPVPALPLLAGLSSA